MSFVKELETIGHSRKKKSVIPRFAIEGIDFSSFTTPYISNTKKGNPLDIQAKSFVSTPVYPQIRFWTSWISSNLLF